MPANAPLQILIFRHDEDEDTLPFEDAIVRAFQGGKEAGGYLATGEDIGIQLQRFSNTPSLTVAATFEGFSHTFAVVLVDGFLLQKSDASLWDWLADLWNHISVSNGQHSILVVPLDERVGEEFSRRRPAFSRIQLLQVHDLGERAIRAAMLALRLLHECRLLLARALPPIGGREATHLRLFISHAKIDGIPLAHALKRQIEAMGWLARFYDVDDLPAGRDWQLELEHGVGSSLIVMLRTDIYDTRYWCQQEVLWADEYATPAVLVDARTSLSHAANTLPFDRVPTVRIPDGNLVRILFLALREGLRFAYFARRIKEMESSGELPPKTELKIFSFQPGMSALLRACRELDEKRDTADNRWIIYPDPPLRAGLREAADALVAAYSPGVNLLTPNTIASLGGTRP